jgi:hypothetical protein
MPRLLASLLFCLVCSGAAEAAQKFVCGSAQVDIGIVARPGSHWEERIDSVVTVSKDGLSTVLRYRGIDFIGGECLISGKTPLVVFQAYCGGSGCADLANWGVIDANTLRVLTVPTDSNMDVTKAIIGRTSLPQLRMMNVLDEARTAGIAVP